MFRRIEVVDCIVLLESRRKTAIEKIWRKRGLNFAAGYLMSELGLKAPDLQRPRGAKAIRFFFTEAGWKKVGRAVLHDLLRQKLYDTVRVIAIKEKSVDVIYRDTLQVVT